MKKKKTSTSNKKTKDTSEMRGFFLLAFSTLLFLSLLNFPANSEAPHGLGVAGYWLGYFFHALFGLSSYILGLFYGWIGWRLLFKKSLNHLFVKSLYVGLLVISTSLLLSVIEDQLPFLRNYILEKFYPISYGKKIRFHVGGAPFYFLYRDLPSYNLAHILNPLGAGLLAAIGLIISSLFLTKTSPAAIMLTLKNLKLNLQKSLEASSASKNFEAKPIPEKESDFLRFVKLRTLEHPPSSQADMLAIEPETELTSRPSVSKKEKIDPTKKKEGEPFASRAATFSAPIHQEPKVLEPESKSLSPLPKKREAALTAQKVHNGDFTSYVLPSPSLLTQAKKLDQSTLKKDLKHKAEVLEETLSSFGIEAKVGQINCGPTITSFEVQPAIGVKVQKIKTLENDIALNMEAKSIRIIAPIPGKAVVGIEVPNAQPEEVGFKEMVTAYQQGSRKFQIPILLGKAVNGDYVMSDLTKMPHCIIAGATGSGKSVCINTIVMSIVMNCKPDQVKLVMVDPKKVELTPYTRLPHMLAPVITEPPGACLAMNWLVKEMEKRYELLKQIGSRNIEAFNARTVDKQFESSLGLEIPEKIPYIVGIVDELADLMMVSSSDIETPIARIAQMARAVGIHLILATQRPSREVITGLIKANFPTRISFKVSSRVNSQIILDDIGAESLLGNGDLLFLPPGASHLVRAQGAFIRDEDIHSVVKIVSEQAPPKYAIASFDRMDQAEATNLYLEPGDEGDELYSEALDIVLGTGNASTTFLQRKLKIGYARAASLMDALEKNGVVSPAEGSKPRKILLSRTQGKSEQVEDQDVGESLQE